MTGIVEHILRTLKAVEEITRPPRMGHDVDTPDGAEQLAQAEEDQECWEAGELPNLYEPALTPDELVGVRGLLQERYGESVEDYMARAERVEGGYIIHDTPDDDYSQAFKDAVDADALRRRDRRDRFRDNRLDDLAAATYSSATPTADDPAGVEHPPVPPAGVPLSGADLWDAGHYVDECAANAAIAGNKYAQERLESLATRLRDASRARRK